MECAGMSWSLPTLLVPVQSCLGNVPFTLKQAPLLGAFCLPSLAGMSIPVSTVQKEEQEHGKAIYDYMTANNMYS